MPDGSPEKKGSIENRNAIWQTYKWRKFRALEEKKCAGPKSVSDSLMKYESGQFLRYIIFPTLWLQIGVLNYFFTF